MDNAESSYRRFAAGDGKAFDEILDAYNESLIFFIRRYVHSLDVAEDIAEDCFVELIVNPRRYNFKVCLKTYLFTIARNKAVDYIRHNAVLELSPLDEHIHKSAEYIGFEQRVLNDEKRKAVNRAVESLCDDMRTAVHLIYFEQMSYEETARIMHKNRKQIENLAYRARKQLRQILTEEGWNDEDQS